MSKPLISHITISFSSRHINEWRVGVWVSPKLRSNSFCGGGAATKKAAIVHAREVARVLSKPKIWLGNKKQGAIGYTRSTFAKWRTKAKEISL